MRKLVAAVAVLVTAIGVGAGTALADSGSSKTVLSEQPSDYTPATINGTATIIDPRSQSPSPKTTPSCEIPPGGVVFTPLANQTQAVPATETLGGAWTCNEANIGLNFTAGIDAVRSTPDTPRLTKKYLYTPGVGTDLHSVKTRTVKVNGKKYKVFTATVSAPVPGGQPGAKYPVAAVEARRHVLLATSMPVGQDPVPVLKDMIKTGGGSAPRLTTTG
jgi:hypothetical protein